MTDGAESEIEYLRNKFPLVYKHAEVYAVKLIQKAWRRYQMRIVYKYLNDCCKDFEENLNARELSRIFPEFLEHSDSKIPSKLRVRMQGTSFPPTLVCKVTTPSAPSVDGGKHNPKWIPLYSAGMMGPIDYRALSLVFLEAVHTKKLKIEKSE